MKTLPLPLPLQRVVLTAALLLALAPLATLADAERSEATLTYLSSALDDEQIAELREIAPNVRVVTGLDEAEMLARANEFDGADAHLLTEEFLEKAARLRWAQSWSAGVDRYMKLKGLVENDRITLTNMRGVHGPAIAEHTFAMLLSLTRDLPAYLDAQQASIWNRDASSRMTTLSGRTMLVVGMGGIGSQIARRARGFDMRVLATVRTKRAAPAFVDKLGTGADLERFLGEADVVVVALPLTEETRGLFDETRFAQFKEGAYFVNIGRGKIVQTEALMKALDSGRLAGVALDVTDPEPLPRDHPLWTRERVIITPHVSARAELTRERRWDMIRENMRRFSQGEELANVVDKKLGY